MRHLTPQKKMGEIRLVLLCGLVDKPVFMRSVKRLEVANVNSGFLFLGGVKILVQIVLVKRIVLISGSYSYSNLLAVAFV